MAYDILNQGLLHMLGIGDNKLMTAIGIVQSDRLIGKDRESYHALITDNLNTVFASTLVGNKAP